MHIDESFFADPHGMYARLRASRSVHRVTGPGGAAAWLVTRYPDVRAALQDPRLSTNAATSHGGDYQGLPLPPALRNDLLHLDPPDHTRLRRLVAPAFTRRAIEGLRPTVQAHTDTLIDAVHPAGEADLLAALALPLPLRVICGLLGLPASAGAQIASWTDALLIPGRPHAILDAMRQAEAQLRDVITHKRRHPADDLLSTLIQARDADDRLTEDELVSLSFILLAAGHDTTASMVCNGILALLDPRMHWERLLARPELLPTAIEELLRYEGPLPLAIRRFATEDLELGGVRISAGDSVLLSLASANRDAAHFPCADDVVLDRTPNPHLSFGRGTHLCLGIPLARLQADVVFATLLRRTPKIELAVPASRLTWRPTHRTRRLESLPVTF
ncbi:cytochrome P450 [Streptomyces sp. NPDC127098]|uniref:cytochrome P450 family protein n=1 Tax=Streptomyces sp. NPDC127098 TaxID=3347137 RepID=UPI00364E2D2B